ncbi:SH3 type 3 domain-containing protein [Bathymodiolus azoricus thioautotrophic gill symbiont]|uniref:SH3 type 3 domain-containing protein n=1 Tax=Bathymodiolus azoricus thioautotrophic gill symbiont TaxID=235205 RepID=A0A1H6LS22_9GAMM|nr:SH3 type 3 domain-containing protein [Bathymodiolus azoricus thioautotrophic gill symbiont]
MVPIPMRSENKIQNNPSNLIKMLDSGTKLKILATEDGWTKVRFENTTGWMISRYLTSNTPARVQLEVLQRNNNNNKLSLAKQNEKNTMLEGLTADLKAKNTKLSIRIGKLESEKEYIKQTYQDSLKLEHENKKLRTATLQLQAELQLLENNNTVGQDSSARNWFIVGALVLFFGFMVGFVFQKRTNNRIF